MAVLYGAMAALAVASIAKVAVRAAALTFALLYVAALVAGRSLVADPAAIEGQRAWLYYICTVATTAAVVALSVPLATVYTIIVPALYGVIRLLPAGGAAVPLLAVLDAMYAVILGSVVLIIVTMLRQAAESVDGAQEAALQRYDHAARQHATEIERVKVDALVHDSVLTTLLSAAAAGSPEEKALAARMARRRGRSASTRPAPTARVRSRRSACPCSSGGCGPRSRPSPRRSPCASSTPVPSSCPSRPSTRCTPRPCRRWSTACSTPTNRAAARARELRIRGIGAGGCVIEVADDGVGFDRHDVPDERLGLRVSIVERIANAGGAAEIVSRPGQGTTVAIAWPAGAAGGDAP